MDQSTRSETKSSKNKRASAPAILFGQNLDEDQLHEQNVGATMGTGQDDAVDMFGEFFLPLPFLEEPQHRSASYRSNSPNESHEHPNDSEEEFPDVPMPLVSTGPSTFAYQRALKNRIRSGKLDRGGDYDKRAFTPTFVHDCLMLPGSLANVLGKGSAEQIIHRMTPALLPEFRTHVHVETEQPCLLQSNEPKSYVQGMLIFGEGKDGRERIHKHYRPYAKRIKLRVETEVAVPVPSSERMYPYERWILRRKRLWAHAWLWRNVHDIDTQLRPDVRCWRLEDYLSSKYAINQAMRVENDVGENYYVEEELEQQDRWDECVEFDDEKPWEPESEPNPDQLGLGTEVESLTLQDRDELAGREVSYGGPGGLSWERSNAAVGRW